MAVSDKFAIIILSNQSAVTITDARISDAAACSTIAKAAYQQYLTRMQQPPAPMLADYAVAIRDNKVIVARSNDSPATTIGFAIIFCQPDYAQLENIAVLPAYQGLGIGKQLLLAVEQRLKPHYSCYQLYTNLVMHENIAWYRRLGFRQTSYKIEQGYKRIYFEKQLR